MLQINYKFYSAFPYKLILTIGLPVRLFC